MLQVYILMHLSGCTSLNSITIPHSIATIKKYAFFKSGLTNINVCGYSETPEEWEEGWNVIDASNNIICNVTWNYQQQ